MNDPSAATDSSPSSAIAPHPLVPPARARRIAPRTTVSGERDVAATLRGIALWATPVLALLLAYAIPLLIVPPTHATPLIDDWNYLLSVRHLVDRGELWVAPWTAATLVLQIGWGALFALVLGVTPVALRWSTLVASFAGTVTCFALFRELGAPKLRAVAGALAVWLNPLVLTLSYTFMTEIPYAALLNLGIYATVRAVRRQDPTWLAYSSAFAGLAFLVRQQGVLLPLATVGWFVLVQSSWYRSDRLRLLGATLGPCLVAVVVYFAWTIGAGIPSTQGDYIDSVQRAGLGGVLDHLWRLATVAVFFLGLFIFPVVLGALRSLPTAWRRAGLGSRIAAVALLIGLLTWTRWYADRSNDRTFPFIPWGSVLHEDGIGVLDAEGLRPFFFEAWVYATMAIVLAMTAAAGFLLVAGRPRETADGETRAFFWSSLGGLLAVLAAGQFAGAILPSLYIRRWITFDRYYLPMISMAIGLLLWSLRDRPLAWAPVAAGLLLYAFVGLVGLQDWFAFKQAQWSAATWLVQEQGVPARQVDGAVQWDGTLFYEAHVANPADWAQRRVDDPWWLWIVAPMIDPVYIVAASPHPKPGYELFNRRPYHSWIRDDEDSWVYIWHRLPA